MGHVAHAQLMIAPIVVTGRMTSEEHCYCGARGTRVGATSVHNRDRSYDISRPLLLPPIMAMGRLTSAGHCYSGTWHARSSY
jgi:hypothetical protein